VWLTHPMPSLIQRRIRRMVTVAIVTAIRRLLCRSLCQCFAAGGDTEAIGAMAGITVTDILVTTGIIKLRFSQVARDIMSHSRY